MSYSLSDRVPTSSLPNYFSPSIMLTSLNNIAVVETTYTYVQVGVGINLPEGSAWGFTPITPPPRILTLFLLYERILA